MQALRCIFHIYIHLDAGKEKDQKTGAGEWHTSGLNNIRHMQLPLQYPCNCQNNGNYAYEKVK